MHGVRVHLTTPSVLELHQEYAATEDVRVLLLAYGTKTWQCLVAVVRIGGRTEHS